MLTVDPARTYPARRWLDEVDDTPRRHDDTKGVTRRDFLPGAAATAARAAALPQRAGAGRRRSPSSTPTSICSIRPGRRARLTAARACQAARRLPAYPDRYRKLAVPLGSVGAIKVEASPWVEDNLWVLDVSQRDTIIVGVIGNLEPDKPEFKEYFDRYRKHPLFRGIRYGNLWGRDIAKQARQPGLHRRAQAPGRRRPRARHGQPADDAARIDAQDQRQGAEPAHRARPSAELRADARRAPGYDAGAQGIRQAAADLRQAVGDPPPRGRQGVDRRQQLPRRSSICSSRRSARTASCSAATGPTATAWRRSIRSSAIAKAYFASKPRAVAEKYFWRNSVDVYKWIKREPSQPTA